MSKKTLYQLQYENERQKNLEDKAVGCAALVFFGWIPALILFILVFG